MNLTTLKLLVTLFFLLANPSLASQLCQNALSQSSQSEFVETNPTKNSLRSMIDSATHDLLSSYNFDLLETLLTSVQKREAEGVNANLYQSLKLARKKWLILRAAFEIATKDHEVPSELDRMVRSLGRLNDMIAFDQTNSIANQITKVRKQLQKVRDRKTIENLPKMASDKSLHKYLKEKKDHIKMILEKKTITIDEYHRVRKNLKVFLTFYSFFERVGEKDRSTYLYLNDLITRMGDLNDLLTQGILNGLRSKHDEMVFPEEFKTEIELLLKQISTDPSDYRRSEQILVQ